jgi:hypothetical protein
MNDIETYSQETKLPELVDNSSIMRSDISERISIAQAYPRNVQAAIQEAHALVVSDQKTAQSCFYMKPQGKEKIPGASIRLAEIIMYCWGHVDVGTQIISNDGKFITARGTFIDLQRNTRVSAEVSMSIRTKEGKLYSNDMQVNIANAVSSKALRNAIFRGIPKFITNQLFEAARTAAVGDVKTLVEKSRVAVNFFSQMGIHEKDILTYFKVESVDKLSAENYADMLAIKNSIKNRELTIDNAFSHDSLTGETQSPMLDDLKNQMNG